jgi:DNA-binding NarL/FixJ family response regulator
MISPTIRVAVVEDDEVVRESLCLLISGTPGFACVATCGSAEEALRRLPAVAPEVVLLDIRLPRMSGTECVPRLKEACPAAQIVMLTMFEDDRAIFDSLVAGASGYLLKRAPQARILEAIEEVQAGGSPMSGTIARRIVQSLQRPRFEGTSLGAGPHGTGGLPHISPREQEVLALLARGYRYKEIAESLGIHVETVRTHLRRIYEKLHVSTRTEAVVKYLGH